MDSALVMPQVITRCRAHIESEVVTDRSQSIGARAGWQSENRLVVNFVLLQLYFRTAIQIK